MNFLDEAISAVAPRWAAKRALARVQLRQFERMSGRGAARNRFRDSGASFDVNTGNPDDGRPRRLVDRATILRLAAENPYGKKALNALVNNSVGWGITGAPKGPKALTNLWNEWTAVSDFRGRLDLFGQQELGARTMFREGEVFIAREYVKGASVLPLRIRLFDAGMLAMDKVGENIEDGIEYDTDTGQPVAYWFRRGRIGWRTNKPPVRYPADDVIHLFIEEYVGQKRGISVFEPVVKRLGDIDDALDADLVRRKIESCFVGFRTLNWEDTEIPLGVRENRDDGLPPSEFFEPGMISTLSPGEDIKFGDPKPAGGLSDAVRINLLATAAGIGVTYEKLTGDLSNVNFSSYRAGALEFDTFMERVQYITLIPVALNRIWGWFCQAAYEFGRVSKPSYPMRWTPPPRKSIDRKGDAEADILEMQAGLENRRSLLNSRGLDHDSFIEDTAADLAKQQGAGLFFKGDPFTAAQAAAGTTGADAAGEQATSADRALLLTLARRLFVGTLPDA